MDALKELLAKVEAGAHLLTLRDFHDAFHTLPPLLQSKRHAPHAWDAYRGGIDAAQWLHEAGLPGWTPGFQQNDDKSWFCELREGWCTSYNRVVMADSEILARAWLIAILKALIAETQAHPGGLAGGPEGPNAENANENNA